MLDFNKRHYLVTQVTEATDDSKKLFKIVNNVLGKKKENLLPPATDDRQLADEFADYFLNKIEKKSGTNLLAYSHTNLDS